MYTEASYPIGLSKPFKWMLQSLGSPSSERHIFSQQKYLNLQLLEHSLGNQHLHCKVWSLLVLIYFTGLLLDLELVKRILVRSGSYLYIEDLLPLDSHFLARATAISAQTSHLQDYSPVLTGMGGVGTVLKAPPRQVICRIRIRKGFCIGCNRMQALQNATNNLPNQVLRWQLFSLDLVKCHYDQWHGHGR